MKYNLSLFFSFTIHTICERWSCQLWTKSLISSFQIWILLLFLALSHWQGPTVQCWTKVVRIDISTLLLVRREAFNILPLNMMLVVGFSDILYQQGPQPFCTRDWFHGRQVFHRPGLGDGSGGNASNGERQMKLHSLARRSPPAVRPGS